MAPEDTSDVGNVLFDLWLASRATTALIDKSIRSSGLDADEFGVYSVLASGSVVTPTELSLWMSAPATTVSSYVKRLEARGHLRRVSNPDDRRSYRLELTPKGRQAHQTAGAMFARILDHVNHKIDDDLDVSRRSLQGLHRAVANFNPTD